MALQIRSGKKTKFINKLITIPVLMLALVAQPMYGLVASQVASALGSVIEINTVAELKDAITNQADGQTWNIAAGDYGLMADFTHAGENKLFFPITADNITINGLGNPTIYGAEYTSNGSGGLQGSFINVIGDNVSINGITVMSKVYVNKAIEVRGSNSLINNVVVAPNTKVDDSVFIASGYPDYSRNWAGSIYYYSGSAHTLNNTTIRNGGVSHWSSGETLTLNNTSLVYDAPCIPTTWCDATIYSYRVRDNGNTIIGTPKITYRVSSDRTNLTNAITNHQAGDTIELDSDITTNSQITLSKPNVIFNGNGHTIVNNRDNTAKDNSNNSAIGIQANGVTVNNLTIDGTGGVWMHGINAYEATGVALNSVTLQNSSNAGLIVGKDSNVTVKDITTKNNGWYGINVDKKAGTSATLTVNGVSTHDEDATAHIYIDDRDATGNTVNDPGLQYVRYWKNAGYQYLLDRSKPTVTSTIAAENPTEFSVHATDDQRLIRIDYSIWNKDRTVQIGVWGQNIDGHVKVFDKTLTEYRVGTTAAYKALTELPDGEYQLNVTVGDVRGKSTNATVAYFKIGDFTAPTASITVESPAGTGSLHRNIVKVTGSVGVTDTDIKSHWIEIKNPDGSLSYSYNMNTTSLTHSFDLDTSKGDGEYRIRYVATDRDGNRSDRSGDTIRVIMVDNSAPVITDIATTATPTSITVSGKTDSPDRPVFVTLDGDTQEATVDPTTGEWTITFTGLTSDAPYPFTVRSADAVDNVFESSAPARTAVAVVVVPGGRQVTAEVPVVDDEDDDQTNFIAFLPATFGGLGVNDDAAVTPLLPATPAADGDDEPDVLGAEDTKANWSVVNAALAGFIAILAVVALAGIRRNEADNNTGARLFMIVPAAAAVIAFFLIEDISGSMGWFNVWTWLFAGILVVQAILATLTTRTAND